MTDRTTEPAPTTGQLAAQSRTEVLARVATALAEATDVAGVTSALIRVLCPAFADTCEVALRGQDGAVWRVASGPGEMTRRIRTPVPDIPGHPLRRAVDGEFLVIHVDDDPGEQLFGPASSPNSARALGIRSAVVAPLTSGSINVGAIALAMRSPHREFATEDHELVRVIAGLIGRTVDNLVTADLQRRVTARLRTANAIAMGFAEANEPAVIAEVLLTRAGEELGARSGLVYLFDDEPAFTHGADASPRVLHLVASFGLRPELAEAWRSAPSDAPSLVTDVIRSGTSIWLESLDDVLARHQLVGETLGMDDTSDRSIAAVRLAQGVDVVGVAFWTFEGPRRFDDADRGFLELTAEQAAAAIRRARATAEAARTLARLTESEQRQRSIARTLQSSLLPRDLPVIDGFDLHVEYWPATSDMDVGGDFYDVFPIEPGRWGMVLGDVCGKGAAAAAVTGTARHSLRAAATHIRDEARTIRWVHDAIASQPDAPYCTMAYAVLDIADPCHLRVLLAGHDQGIRIGSDGSISHLGRFGTLLGIVQPTVEVDIVTLEPGDLVVFHTDGVTDAPRGEAVERPELIDVLVRMREQPLAAIGATLRAALDARRPHGDRDDTALLLLRRG